MSSSPPPLTNTQFRADFPEFAITTMFPESTITYWMGIGNLLLNATQWGNLFNHGLELFVAHNIVLEAVDQGTVTAGGFPGLNKGIVSAKAAGPVSVSYDTAAGMEENAGHWNLTTYGTRFLRLARMQGMGPVQIGVDGGTWPGIKGFDPNQP